MRKLTKVEFQLTSEQEQILQPVFLLVQKQALRGKFNDKDKGAILGQIFDGILPYTTVVYCPPKLAQAINRAIKKFKRG